MYLILKVITMLFQGPGNNEQLGRLEELSSPPVLPTTSGVVPVCEVSHLPPGMPIQYNMTDFVVGQHSWPGNIIVPQLNQPIEVNFYYDS